ncbi:MAG: (2Fe-2S)-binding protein [Candidatus Sumerlaeota bacterium]|nr:(2Fe-2S)-binding protein [Candidatus Sumerlaeota bacterium]
MRPYDREVCLCFHVPLGKIAKFARLHDPPVASELSNCYGAGTGCGWCVPFLERVFEQVKAGQEPSLKMSKEEYRRRRDEYRRSLGYPAELPDGPAGDSLPDHTPHGE